MCVSMLNPNNISRIELRMPIWAQVFVYIYIYIYIFFFFCVDLIILGLSLECLYGLKSLKIIANWRLKGKPINDSFLSQVFKNLLQIEAQRKRKYVTFGNCYPLVSHDGLCSFYSPVGFWVGSTSLKIKPKENTNIEIALVFLF